MEKVRGALEIVEKTMGSVWSMQLIATSACAALFVALAIVTIVVIHKKGDFFLPVALTSILAVSTILIDSGDGVLSHITKTPKERAFMMETNRLTVEFNRAQNTILYVCPDPAKWTTWDTAARARWNEYQKRMERKEVPSMENCFSKL